MNLNKYKKQSGTLTKNKPNLFYMTEIIQTKFDKIIKENKLNKSAILRDLVSDFIDKYEIENQ
jgi:hypothetical protein